MSEKHLFNPRLMGRGRSPCGAEIARGRGGRFGRNMSRDMRMGRGRGMNINRGGCAIGGPGYGMGEGQGEGKNRNG